RVPRDEQRPPAGARRPRPPREGRRCRRAGDGGHVRADPRRVRPRRHADPALLHTRRDQLRAARHRGRRVRGLRPLRERDVVAALPAGGRLLRAVEQVPRVPDEVPRPENVPEVQVVRDRPRRLPCLQVVRHAARQDLQPEAGGVGAGPSGAWHLMAAYEGPVTMIADDGTRIDGADGSLVIPDDPPPDEPWFGTVKGDFDAFDLMEGTPTLVLPDGRRAPFKLTRTDLVVAREGVDVTGLDALR